MKTAPFSCRSTKPSSDDANAQGAAIIKSDRSMRRGGRHGFNSHRSARFCVVSRISTGDCGKQRQSTDPASPAAVAVAVAAHIRAKVVYFRLRLAVFFVGRRPFPGRPARR